MKDSQNGFHQHKVGYVHYFGTILADALKSDNSGNTVSMYLKTDMSEIPYILTYTVAEWDKSGQVELKVEKYDNYEEALISYLSTTFGVSL